MVGAGTSVLVREAAWPEKQATSFAPGAAAKAPLDTLRTRYLAGSDLLDGRHPETALDLALAPVDHLKSRTSYRKAASPSGARQSAADSVNLLVMTPLGSTNTGTHSGLPDNCSRDTTPRVRPVPPYRMLRSSSPVAVTVQKDQPLRYRTTCGSSARTTATAAPPGSSYVPWPGPDGIVTAPDERS